MTTEVRIQSLHTRMDALRRVRERRMTGAVGGACIVLAAGLIRLIFGGDTAHIVGTAGMYSGASMLFGSSGGYVLVALITFTAAVIITVLCMRWRSRKDGQKIPDKEIEYEKQNKEDKG